MSERYLFAGQSYMFYPLHLVFSGFDFYGQHTCTNPLSPNIERRENTLGFLNFFPVILQKYVLDREKKKSHQKIVRYLWHAQNRP